MDPLAPLPQAANDPPLIRLGHLLPGAQPLGALKGASDTYRGLIEVEGQRLDAYVKFLGSREVFNEALGSVLCRLAGLRTPAAFVVQVQRAEYPASPALAQLTTPTAVAFATEAMAAQSLLRRVDLASPEARKTVVREWKQWPETLVFDQWIRNGDRHLDNMLIGAVGEVYLIDHGLAFGQRQWNAADLLGLPDDAMTRLWNELLVHATDPVARVAAVPNVQQSAVTLSTIDTSAACDLTQLANDLPTADRVALVSFLAARCRTAANHVCNTMGVPQLALGAIA